MEKGREEEGGGVEEEGVRTLRAKIVHSGDEPEPCYIFEGVDDGQRLPDPSVGTRSPDTAATDGQIFTDYSAADGQCCAEDNTADV